MSPRTGRLENRIPISVSVRLARLQKPGDVEKTVTENVSTRGARVLARHQWHPEEPLLVTSLGNEVSTQARVVYCHPVKEGLFGVGLQFMQPSLDWKRTPTQTVT